MTQTKQILRHLKAGHSLTPLRALSKFRCFRLGARIYDLKGEGHKIKTRLVERRGARVAEYRLAH